MDRRGFLLGTVVAAAAACGGRGGSTSATTQPVDTSGAGDTGTGGATSTSGPDGAAPPAPATSAVTPQRTSLHTVTWSPDRTDYPAPEPFGHGLASGEPEAGAVTIWTQLTDPAVAPELSWQVAADPDMAEVVAAGTVAAGDGARSARVRVEGLAAGRSWFYRFQVAGASSPVGRTLTLPPPGPGPAGAVLALASCQHYEEGFFGALADLADAAVDLVVFVGDFVYSRRGSGSPVRDLPPARSGGSGGGGAPNSLDGWRALYAASLRDGDLQRARAVGPWLVSWDDNERRGPLGPAVQAWWEHQPVGSPPPVDGALDIRRSVDLGGLARIVVLDTRSWRDEPVCDRIERLGVAERCPELDDPSRTMLGPDQEAWVAAQLDGSGATWNLLAQQVVMSDLAVSAFGVSAVNDDQWDGFPQARARLLAAAAAADNPVVLSGDLHSAGIGVLRGTDGRPAAVEVIGPSVSSLVPDRVALGLEVAAAGQPDLVHFDHSRRGWTSLRLTPTELVVRFRHVDAMVAGAAATDGPAFRVAAGRSAVTPA